MKKSLIATGAAAVALAAMPALGAFADVTDTVTLTIQSACTIGQNAADPSTGGTGKTITEANALNAHMYTYDANGTDGGTIKVSCNDNGGWMIKAVGSGDDTTNKNVMNASSVGTDIATGTPAEGAATSTWGFKVAAATGQQGITVESAYQNFTAVPAEATKVASGTGAISEGGINTGYQVWVSATQQADTYTGKVTYTVHHPNA